MKLKVPHTFVIVTAVLLLCGVLTWIIPAGEFSRTEIVIEGSTREIIVEDSYHSVPQAPQTWQIFGSIVDGFRRQAGIIAFILIIGGAFGLLTGTRAIDFGISSFLERSKRLERSSAMRFLGVNNIVIVCCMLIFSMFGAVFGMSEETIAFVIIIVPLAISMGYDSITGLLMVYVAAHIGFSGAMFNPFTIGIAQGLSGVPIFSGFEYRFVVWVILTLLIIAFTLVYARRIKKNPQLSPTYKIDEYWRNKILVPGNGSKSAPAEAPSGSAPAEAPSGSAPAEAPSGSILANSSAKASSTSTQSGTTSSAATQSATIPSPATQSGTSPSPATQSATTPSTATQSGTSPSPATQSGTIPSPATQSGTTPSPATQSGTTSSPATQYGTSPSPATQSGTSPSPANSSITSHSTSSLNTKAPLGAWIVYAAVSILLTVSSILHPNITLAVGNSSASFICLPIIAALWLLCGWLTIRRGALSFILNILAFTILILIAGVLGYGWYISEIATLFIAMGICATLSAGWGSNKIAVEFISGAKDILSAALVVGLAGGIIEILTNGKILDTILYSLASGMEGGGKVGSVSAMYGIQTVLNLFIPSGSAKAALTMPIMAPFSDIIGISRQATIMAFQFGDGFTNMITPTSGVLLGALGAARIPYSLWVKWFWKILLVFIIIGFLLLLPTVFLTLPGF